MKLKMMFGMMLVTAFSFAASAGDAIVPAQDGGNVWNCPSGYWATSAGQCYNLDRKWKTVPAQDGGSVWNCPSGYWATSDGSCYDTADYNFKEMPAQDGGNVWNCPSGYWATGDGKCYYTNN